MNTPPSFNRQLGICYLTDKNSHQISKFDENGEFIKVLGARGSEAGQFY
jgi:hypothetical protein